MTRAHVEFVRDEFLRQIVEQFGVGRRIARPNIVDWLDDSDSCEIAPDAVHIAGGKEPIVCAGDPRGKLIAPRAGRLRLRLIREGGFSHLVRAKMHHFTRLPILHHFPERMSLFHGRTDDHAFAAGGVGRQFHLCKECAEVIILVLRPAFKRMIVALVAIKAGREEKMRRVLHCFRRFAQDLPIAGRGMILV